MARPPPPHTHTLSSWMSLSMPRGPRVVRTVSVSAMQALMLLGRGGRQEGAGASCTGGCALEVVCVAALLQHLCLDLLWRLP